MTLFKLRWMVLIAVYFAGNVKAQRRDEGFIPLRGPQQSQNVQTDQKIQPPTQLNQQQRWSSYRTSGGVNQQTYGREPQKAPTAVNVPLNNGNNGLQRVPTAAANNNNNYNYNNNNNNNNGISRPIFNVPPRSSDATHNSRFIKPINFGNPQRETPQIQPIRPINNGFNRQTNNDFSRPNYFGSAPRETPQPFASERPLGVINNGFNRQGDYAQSQRNPSINSEPNRSFVNGPQRTLVAVDNAPNSQTRGVADRFVLNRPVSNEPQRQSFETNNLRNRPVYYGGSRRFRGSRIESNAPIYIRRAQRPLIINDTTPGQIIYNDGGPIIVIDKEPEKSDITNKLQSGSETASDSGVSTLTKLSQKESSKTVDISPVISETVKDADNSELKITSSTVTDRPKLLKTSNGSSKENIDESQLSVSRDATEGRIEKIVKSTESNTQSSSVHKQKTNNQLETSTLSSNQDISSKSTQAGPEPTISNEEN